MSIETNKESPEVSTVDQLKKLRVDVTTFIEGLLKGIEGAVKSIPTTLAGIFLAQPGNAATTTPKPETAPATGADKPSRRIDMANAKTVLDVFKQLDQAYIQKKLGEMPLIVLFAQMRLESGENLSELAKKNNNFFGIKYSKDIKNAEPVSYLSAEQDKQGNERMKRSDFAKFLTPEDCFIHYAEQMMGPESTKSRYNWLQGLSQKLQNTYMVKKDGKWETVKNPPQPPQGGISMRGNPVIAIASIKESGYATDVAYVKKIYDVMSDNKTAFNYSQDVLDAGLAYVESLKGKTTLAATARSYGVNVPSVVA